MIVNVSLAALAHLSTSFCLKGADGPDTLRWDVESALKLLLRPDSGTRPEMRSVPVERLSCRRAQQVGPALLVRPLHDGVLIP